MRLTKCLGFFVSCLIVANTVAQPKGGGAAITDGEIEITAGALRYAYENAPKQLKGQIANDETGRYEFIASIISSKRALQNLQTSLDKESDLYYEFTFAILAAAKEFDEKRFQRELQVPDVEELAEERFRISKSEIAKVPEQRQLSHILLLCSEACEEAQKKEELEDIRARILDGESFGDLAIQFSEDPGSYQRGGKLSRPIAEFDENVDESFRQVAFELEETGEISAVVKSRFGFHIMRLDSILPERERTFEEVKAPLMAEVEKRYREDAYRTYLLSIGPSEDLIIDGRVVDEIMGALPTLQE